MLLSISTSPEKKNPPYQKIIRGCAFSSLQSIYASKSGAGYEKRNHKCQVKFIVFSNHGKGLVLGNVKDTFVTHLHSVNKNKIFIG